MKFGTSQSLWSKHLLGELLLPGTKKTLKKNVKASSANSAKIREVLLQDSKANIENSALRFPYSESKGHGTFHKLFGQQ